MAGDSKAKVIPLHGNSGRAAAQRRAGQRTRPPASIPPCFPSPTPGLRPTRSPPSSVKSTSTVVGPGAQSTPNSRATNSSRRSVPSPTSCDTGSPATTASTSSASTRTSTTRSCGRCCRFFFNSWFRVEVSGIENLPDTGAGLVVANHAGVLPFDGLMASVAVHDKHPAHRDLRLLAADMVFDLPVVSAAARKAGHTMACTADAHRLLAAGELTAVFPEGYKGLGKRFKDRYKLQRFGRGGFVAAALRAKAPIIPCSIVGSEEIYPMLTDVKLLARLFGLPYFPITPLFPLAGPAGLVPLPSKWHIAFGEPIDTAHYDGADAEDPMVTFELTDQVRETIQQTLYQLLAGRRNMFFG